jgi:hypothetical protein
MRRKRTTFLVQFVIFAALVGGLSYCHWYFTSTDWIIGNGLGMRRRLPVYPFRLDDMFDAVQESKEDITPKLISRYHAQLSFYERVNILRALAARGDSNYIERIICLVDSEADENLRMEGYLALGFLGHTTALGFLRSSAISDRNWGNRESAALSAYFISGIPEPYLDRQQREQTAPHHPALRIKRDHVKSLQRAREIFRLTCQEASYTNPVTERKSIYHGFGHKEETTPEGM